MSPFLPHAAHLSPQRAPLTRSTPPPNRSSGRPRAWASRLVLAWACVASACGSDDATGTLHPDGAFGSPADPSRDAGLDGSTSLPDAGSVSANRVRVRFVHAIPNTGALLVCYDPDGPGPVSADVLRQDTEVLRADYGTRSNTVLVPALSTGELTLQRDPTRSRGADAGFDGGVLEDGGSPVGPCDLGLREATIPLPITGAWLAPSAAVSDDQLRALDLLPGLNGATALTLFGSGVALNPAEIDRRAASASADWLAAHPGSTQQAAAYGVLERQSLEATFGARALIQPDHSAGQPAMFSLSVFHAIPDVAPADSTLADRAIGAVRLCVTAGSRDSGVLPKPPQQGVPFRVRTLVGDSFEAGLSYEFRVFAQGAFDAKDQDCSTTSLLPLAKASFSNFMPGHAYTLALFGVVAPVPLCSANDVSIARASCSRPASELGARIDLLVD
ncbi:MAG: hypothetical protein JWN48_2029 [Myxococcaceae bacterium]|nr:hypothetical protein [Myxococcaceae bacterium]